jgi:ABC-type uncharacterized transport system permease subunit
MGGKLTTREKVAIAVLLLIPLVYYMTYPAYNMVSPSLGGVSFFYWSQTLWLAISAVLFIAAAIIWERGLSRSGER